VGYGEVALEEGEEDARLLGDEEEEEEDQDQAEEEDGGEGEDEAVRRGRLILRQLHHNSFHLHVRLKEVHKGTGELTESEVRSLTGKRWFGAGSEARFWIDLARRWGMTGED